MATPAELAYLHTDLDPGALEHLQRLMGSWSVLADLSFSDLLLLVPLAPSHPDHAGDRPELVILGQIRPNNRPTLVEDDLVGRTLGELGLQGTAEALHVGSMTRGQVEHPSLGDGVPIANVPVAYGGRVIAVVVRVGEAAERESISPYEKSYLDVFERLAQMVGEAAFPFPDQDIGTEETPRVGDGFVVVDGEGRVEFASPNAINAFHRMGVYSHPEGRRFTELGIEESAVEWALATGRPVVEEVERRPDVIVLVHCIPLLVGGSVTGGVILLRDVTDVRRLDRLLLSKDAAIREVHHRVKNNLQTISSLLSLQARRVEVGEGREALREAERRVRSIAVVHEILARDPGDQVPFADIVVSLVQMAEDSVVSSRPVEFSVSGDLGDVTADVATPLAVILAEVVQNAVEHAFPHHDDGADQAPGHVDIGLAPRGDELYVTVDDDGCGLPGGFDIDRTSSLGLSIVRDLVMSQLGGSITMQAGEGGRGTRVVITVPKTVPSDARGSWIGG